jgi:hypothetical protein
MAGPFYEDFESTAVGSAPANWANTSSPTGGTSGDALVTATSPLVGGHSFAFGSAIDGMVSRNTAYTGSR